MENDDLDIFSNKNVKNIIFFSSLISGLIFAAILLNRWFGIDGIDWKITGSLLSIFAIIAPWLGRNTSNIGLFISTTVIAYFTNIIDSIILVAIFSKSKFSEIHFEWSYFVIPSITLALFMFITYNKKI